MNETKWIGQSKTVIGVIVIMLINLGPFLGLSFNAEDGSMVNTNIDAIMTAVASLFAIFGRVVAEAKVTLSPGGAVSDESGAGNPLAFLAAIFAVTLAGCAAAPHLTVEQRFFQAVGQYNIARSEAVAYAISGPLCSDVDVLGCVIDDVVIALDDIVDEFDPRIAVGVALFEGGEASAETRAEQVAIARQALRALNSTLAEAST